MEIEKIIEEALRCKVALGIKALKTFIKEEKLSSSMLASKTGIPQPTAFRWLKRFCDWGIAEEITGKKGRGRRYKLKDKEKARKILDELTKVLANLTKE